MSEHFVVEADRRVVGVAVRCAGGFRFFSSEPAFSPLDGRVFRRARAVVHAVAKFARTRRGRSAAGGQLTPSLL